MNSLMTAPTPTLPSGADEPSSEMTASSLSDLEREVIEIFVGLVRVLGIPKSVAEIYGLLFLSSEPLVLDTVVERLHISKGSASQGLRLLRSLGAVRLVYQPADRRDHYIAETEIKKLVSGFFREQVQPHLENGNLRLDRLQQMCDDRPANDPQNDFYRKRVGKLSQWHARGKELIPLMEGMLE